MWPSERFKKEYTIKAWLVIVAAILILLTRWFSTALIPQIGHIPLLFPQSEFFYNLFLQSGILQALVKSHLLAALFDITLFFLPVMFLYTLNRAFVVIYFVFCLTYFLSFNIITGHHYHGLVGVLIMLIPFFSKDEARFKLLWQGARYYLIYVFASAALWKIMRGSAFYTDQMSNTLKLQQIDFLLQNPDSWRAGVIAYLIAHPMVSLVALWGTIIFQLSFIVAAFTKKYDSTLLGLMVVFVIMNYCLMNVLSSELLILGISLVTFVVDGEFFKARRVKEEGRP